MTALTIPIAEAPATPLNLQWGQAYAPRVPTPPYVGYAASEVAPDVFEIWAYETDGFGVVLFRGALGETFLRLATHLRMDVAPHDKETI